MKRNGKRPEKRRAVVLRLLVSLSPCLLVSLSLSQLAPPTLRAADVTIPVVGRPVADFYDAAGTPVIVEAKAEPTELTTDDSLTYTLSVRNLLNPAQVRRPDLHQLPDFEQAFQITDLPDPLTKSTDRRVFAYRLRPRDSSVKEVPPLRFRYYRPDIPPPPNRPERAFPTALAPALPITVKQPPQPPPLPPVPLDVPPFAAELASGDAVLSRPSAGPWPPWLWLVALAVPPLAAVAWAVAWRSLFPDAARRAHLRRSRAARRALHALDSARRRPTGDPAATVEGIVIDYLHERFDLPPNARTPAEVASFLAKIGSPPEQQARAAEFFRSGDAARFAPPGLAVVGDLAAEAERLILALEGEA